MSIRKTYKDASEFKPLPFPTRNGNFKDRIGSVFNRLTVINYQGQKSNKSMWLCQCSCGLYIIPNSTDLERGHTKSCGCLDSEVARERMTTHGQSYTREYNIWKGIKTRCLNPSHGDYKNYGAKGITISDEWAKDFNQFYTDMGQSPEKNSTVERIDNTKGYCKDNCKWATYREQSRNRISNRQLTYNGKTQCITDWDKEMGFKQGVIGKRLKRGWSLDFAMTKPENYRFSRKSTT